MTKLHARSALCRQATMFALVSRQMDFIEGIDGILWVRPPVIDLLREGMGKPCRGAPSRRKGWLGG